MCANTNFTVAIEEYATHLRLFISSYRDGLQIKERRELSLLEKRQSRISGGALLKFLRFVTDSGNVESLAVLRDIQQQGRRLLMITDDPGSVAAHDILRMFRPAAVWMLQQEWKAWCQRPESGDESFRFHFEYRSWWTQKIESEWEPDFSLADKHWIHREGYTLDRTHSRDVFHLWEWTGEELQLLRADIRMESA